MERRIHRIVVEGLFGRLDHEIVARSDEPTILTAPNGAGKTHVLMLVHAALGLKLQILMSLPFSKLILTLSDKTGLRVIRKTDADSEARLFFSALKAGKGVGKEVTVSSSYLEQSASTGRHSIIQLPNGQWYDRSIDRQIPRALIERRYPDLLRGAQREIFKGADEILSACREPAPILIDTKRLDVPSIPMGTRFTADDARVSGADPTSGRSATRIVQYIRELESQVADARRNSVQATQSADLSFAARALAAASETVKEEPLHARYDEIVRRYEELARNSLAVGEAPLEFPDKTTPTVRRILNVFLDDWEKRLEPLLPLNEKIRTLRAILDSKLVQSGKKTFMSPRGAMGFRTFDDRPIRVASLSSGEQHLVALFTMLLFSAGPGSVVLIDEPEISFHAAWKHAFLDDISSVARLMDLQIIIATHSSSIINGRWDLTEELRFAQETHLNDALPPLEADELEADDLLD